MNIENQSPEQIQKFKVRVGKNIKMMRINSGLTANDFASKLKISRTHLFRLENATAKAIDFSFIYNMGKTLTDLDRIFREDIEKLIKTRNDELFLNRKAEKKWIE